MSEKDSIFNSKFHKLTSICGLKKKSKSCNNLNEYMDNVSVQKNRSSSFVFSLNGLEDDKIIKMKMKQYDSSDSLISICTIESIPEDFDFSSQPKSLPIPIEKSKNFDSSDSLFSISSSRSYDSLKNLINSEYKDETHVKVPTKRRIRDSQIEISKSPQIKDVLKLLTLSPDLKLVHDFKKI